MGCGGSGEFSNVCAGAGKYRMETAQRISGTCGVAASLRRHTTFRRGTRLDAARAADGWWSSKYSDVSLAIDCVHALLLSAVWRRRDRVLGSGEFEAGGGGRCGRDGVFPEGEDVVLDRICRWSPSRTRSARIFRSDELSFWTVRRGRAVSSNQCGSNREEVRE